MTGTGSKLWSTWVAAQSAFGQQLVNNWSARLNMAKRNARSSTPITQPPEIEQVVLVIHGIRDRAAWHNLVDSVIRSDTVTTWSSKYGYFSVFRFLAPWDMSDKPAARVYQDYLDAKEEYPNAKVSVIAHSFGTQLLTQTLLRYPSIKLWRIILCGAVVKQDFQWSRVKNQIGDKDDPEKRKYIINDCGNEDIWPVLGASAGWRYGDAGTNGFGGPVCDRFHNGGHGLFFTRTFIEEYWNPFIHTGEIKSGTAVQGERIPWLVKFISMLPLNWIIALWFLLIVGGAGWSIWQQIARPQQNDRPVAKWQELSGDQMSLNLANVHLSDKTRDYADWMSSAITEIRNLAHPPRESAARKGLIYSTKLQAEFANPNVAVEGLPLSGIRPTVRAWIFQPKGKGEKRLLDGADVAKRTVLNFSAAAPSGSMLLIAYTVEGDAPALQNVRMKVFIRPGIEPP